MAASHVKGKPVGRVPTPSKLILPGDVLIKAEKCAEETGSLLRQPTSNSYHNTVINSCLKDFSSLDKSLASLEAQVGAVDHSIAVMKSDDAQMRSSCENCIEIVEILKRIERLGTT